MSRPIHAGCPPAPPPVPASPAASDNSSPADSDSTSIFGALLDSRSETRTEEPAKPKADEKKESDTVSPLAVPVFVQILPPPPAAPPPQMIPIGGGCSEPEPVQPAAASKTSEKTAKNAETSDSKPLLDSLIPLEQKLPDAPPPKPAAPEEIAGKAPEKPSLPSGIPAAQQPAMPQAPEKSDANKAAMESGPGSLRIDKFETSAFEQAVQRPDIRELYRNDSKREDRDVRLAPGELLSTSRHAFPARAVQAAAEVQPAAPVTAVSTLEAIHGHVQLLRTTGQDRLEVTLRPDSNTQLFLAVAKVDGRIQVQARCERGDFALLEAHWGAVQSSLSSAGIQVQPLEFSSSVSDQSLSHHGGGQQRQTHSDNFQEIPTPANSALEVKPRPARKHPVSSPARGWQSWA